MPLATAYVRKLEFKGKRDDLIKELEEIINQRAIDLNERHPWKGFLVDPKTREPDYGIDLKDGYVDFTYGHERLVKSDSFDGSQEMFYYPIRIRVLVDLQSKVIFAFTHNRIEANLVYRWISPMNPFLTVPITFPDRFLKWAARHAIQYQPQIMLIHGVKVRGLEELGDSMNSAILNGDGSLTDSPVYQDSSVSQAEHYSLKMTIRVRRNVADVMVYSFGKITISVPSTTVDEIHRLFRHIYQPIVYLHTVWSQQTST